MKKGLTAELGLPTTYLDESTTDLYTYRACDLLIAYIDQITALGEPLLLDNVTVAYLQTYASEDYERSLKQRRYEPYESVQSLCVYLPFEGMANG